MKPKTKAELEAMLELSQKEVSDLKAELKRFEKYESIKKMSDEIYMHLQAMMESGFTRAEAMQIITACCPNGKRS
jgi:hypothetical protein